MQRTTCSGRYGQKVQYFHTRDLLMTLLGTEITISSKSNVENIRFFRIILKFPPCLITAIQNTAFCQKNRIQPETTHSRCKYSVFCMFGAPVLWCLWGAYMCLWCETYSCFMGRIQITSTWKHFSGQCGLQEVSSLQWFVMDNSLIYTALLLLLEHWNIGGWNWLDSNYVGEKQKC